jgi:DNA polymerase III subunit delta'
MGFNNIIGHEKQKSLLLSFLKKGRMPHAFLFSGQEGIGKKLLAIELAKRIFCEKGNGCGECRACLKIERGSHPDLLFVEGENSIGINLIRRDKEKKIRGINEEVYEYPYESDMRVIIIDKADTMTHEAANALLKTLEEPPLFNLFFLVTSSEKDIPLTIRSRCARVAFTSLTSDDLRQYFLRVFNMDEERAQLFSYISHGSIGCGLFWMEEDNFLLRRKLTELIIGHNRSFLNTTLISEKITQTNRQLSMYLSFLLSLFRDMFILNQSRDVSMVINRDVRELLEWEMVDLKWVEYSMRRIQETIRIMRYNVNKWLIFENLMLHIMR